MTWRILWIVVLGAAAAAALASRSCAERDVQVPATTSEQKPDHAIEAVTTEVAREESDPSLATPAERAAPATVAAPGSDLERFVEIRGVPRVAWMDTELEQFAAQPRDPAWATGMEARFQSELAKSSSTLAERYVECRRSLCIALLVHPRGSEPVQRGSLFQPAVSEARATAQALDVIMGPASAVMTGDGAFVEWFRYHRKCGADWKCLE